MVGIFGTTVILHATLVLVPLLVERLQGGNAQTSGIVLLGISALGALAAPIGGRYSDVVGRRRPAVLGTLAVVAGLGALWLVAPEASTLVLGLLLAVVGFGMGMAGSPRQTAALELIEPERVGMAAGTYLTGRYIGGALGATLAGAVLGGTVTAGGVSTGFGILAAVAVGVAVASLFLPGRRATPAARTAGLTRARSAPPTACGAQRVEEPRQGVVPDLRPPALVVEDLARRRIAVAGRQADVPPADLPELGRASLEQRPLQLLERLVAGQLETEIDGAGRVVHAPIVRRGRRRP